MSAEPIPLSPEDRAILALESETIVGHTCKVLVVEAPAVGADALRETIAARISATPELTYQLAGAADAPAWLPDPEVDVAAQVAPFDGGRPVAAKDLATVVAEVFARRLPRDRPLWAIDVVALDDERTALIWRLHHALADGTCAVRLARTVLFDAADAPPLAPKHPAHSDPADDRRRREHLARFLEREFARSRTASPFDARIGTRREVRFADVSLSGLHDAAKGVGATLNDAVLACVGGGVSRWLTEHDRDARELRVKVPVSLHSEGDNAANRDSFFTVPVPLGTTDSVARLTRVTELTRERKAEHDAQEIDSLHRELGRLSPGLEKLAERIEHSPRRFALNVSNVPGPRDPVTMHGSPVSAMHTIAEIGEHHALRVAVVSYAGQLCFGLAADPAVVTDLGGLASGIELEAAALIGAEG
jgi:diacylglycerol O-acyltransferase / wax synthase